MKSSNLIPLEQEVWKKSKFYACCHLLDLIRNEWLWNYALFRVNQASFGLLLSFNQICWFLIRRDLLLHLEKIRFAVKTYLMLSLPMAKNNCIRYIKHKYQSLQTLLPKNLLHWKLFSSLFPWLSCHVKELHWHGTTDRLTEIFQLVGYSLWTKCLRWLIWSVGYIFAKYRKRQ